MMIFVIDMLNHVQVYAGASMLEARTAQNEYMSFMGISEETILMEVIYK